MTGVDSSQRLYEVIYFADRMLRMNVKVNPSNRRERVEEDQYAQWRTQSRSALYAIFGEDSPHHEEFDAATQLKDLHPPLPFQVRAGIGILKGARHDLDSGYTWKLRERVHADIFDDYLEMAESLVDEGFVDAAAVIAGSTLEAHLRSLCSKQPTPVPITDAKGNAKKAAIMNQDLYSNSVYDKTNLKLVDAWLTIRNDPAHGHYSKYDRNQIQQMIEGIREFIARFPA